jgi:DNA polymerase-3 subunit alpha
MADIAPSIASGGNTPPKSTRPFVHLHCHSHYSLLDGASPIGKLIDRVKSLGMNGVALTDHGNLHGALEFYQKAKSAGINPIVGYEAYIAPKSRFERDASSMKEASYHLTLLAQNRTGFKNLVKLASAASLEGFYFKPRIDKEVCCSATAKASFVLSGCLSSEFSRQILEGARHGSKSTRKRWRPRLGFTRVFGDRYFIEIMNNGVDSATHSGAGCRRYRQTHGHCRSSPPAMRITWSKVRPRDPGHSCSASTRASSEPTPTA